MNILDGTSLARNIGEEMKKKVRDLGHKGIKPKLSIILVGNDPASVIYTAKKKKTCQEVGIETELVHLGEDTEEPKLIEMLEDMAADLGADSLSYLGMERLVRATGMAKSDLCLACVNNDYPTEWGRRRYQASLEVARQDAPAETQVP